MEHVRGLLQVETWILGSRRLRTGPVHSARLFAENGEEVNRPGGASWQCWRCKVWCWVRAERKEEVGFLVSFAGERCCQWECQ